MDISLNELELLQRPGTYKWPYNPPDPSLPPDLEGDNFPPLSPSRVGGAAAGKLNSSAKIWAKFKDRDGPADVKRHLVFPESAADHLLYWTDDDDYYSSLEEPEEVHAEAVITVTAPRKCSG